MAHLDTTVDSPAHTPGTPRGEELASKQNEVSFDRFEDDATGINSKDRKPIDPRMPHLPPA